MGIQLSLFFWDIYIYTHNFHLKILLQPEFLPRFGGFFHEKIPSVNDLDVPGYLWEICHLHNDQWQSCWYRPGFDRSDENSRGFFGPDSSSFLYQIFFCSILCIYLSILFHNYCNIYVCFLMSLHFWIHIHIYASLFICISIHAYLSTHLTVKESPVISDHLHPSPPSFSMNVHPSLSLINLTMTIH